MLAALNPVQYPAAVAAGVRHFVHARCMWYLQRVIVLGTLDRGMDSRAVCSILMFCTATVKAQS